MILLFPKKYKFKKVKKGKLSKYEFKANKLIFGTIGLKAIESGLISSKQIEAARQAINRKIQRKGKIWIKIFPSLPITSKPVEVRMGKGKGNLDHWAVRIKAGTVLFELCGISTKNALAAFKTGKAKLPVKTKIIT